MREARGPGHRSGDVERPDTPERRSTSGWPASISVTVHPNTFHTSCFSTLCCSLANRPLTTLQGKGHRWPLHCARNSAVLNTIFLTQLVGASNLDSTAKATNSAASTSHIPLLQPQEETSMDSSRGCDTLKKYHGPHQIYL